MDEYLAPLLGAGANLFGAFQDMKQQNWMNGQIVDLMNRNQRAIDTGQQTWLSNFDPARDSSLQMRDRFQNALFGQEDGTGGSMAQLDQLMQQYPGLLEQLLGSSANPWDRGTSPGMQGAMDQAAGNQNIFSQGADTALGAFQGGGWSPQRQDTQDRFMDLLNGQGAQMGAFSDVGLDLLGNRGQTANTMGFQDRAMDMLNAGGMNGQLNKASIKGAGLLDSDGRTNTLDALQAGGLGMFGNQGFNQQNSALFGAGMGQMNENALGTKGLTQAGGMAEQVGLGDLIAGGQSGASNYLSNRGSNLADREALLPLEQVIANARERAALDTNSAFKRATRQALARRGGSASVVAAGGSENDPMSEWANQASTAVSEAGRKAAESQQGLQLQQMGVGAGMVGQGGALENNRYGAASSLVQGMEGNATNRFGTGGQIAGNAAGNALGFAGLGSQAALGGQGQQTDRFGMGLNAMTNVNAGAGQNANIYGNLGLGAMGVEGNRMGLGSNMLQNFNQNRISGGQLMNGSLTDQGNYALGAGGLANNFGNSSANAANTLFQQMLQSGQFGAGLNQQQMAGFQQLFNNALGLNRDNASNFNSAINNLTTLGGQGNQLQIAGLQQAPPAQQSNQSSAWAPIGSALTNAMMPQNANSGGSSGIQQPFGQTWNPPPYTGGK